ncbi:hase und igel [Musca autumnalis]|uniref:hase und igel n=1 Tax=Musca autumnalis TaxID=221902 RepID=UPI003CED290D
MRFSYYLPVVSVLIAKPIFVVNMKFILSALCLLAVLLAVSADADSAHFIPKAFYTLDAEGHKSQVHPINPHTAHYLRRLRRQTFTSSSSSSSSVSSDGGPAYFSTHTENTHGLGNGYATGHVVHTDGVVTSNGQVYQQTQQGNF